MFTIEFVPINICSEEHMLNFHSSHNLVSCCSKITLDIALFVKQTDTQSVSEVASSPVSKCSVVIILRDTS
jgi:hypothetical protein